MRAPLKSWMGPTLAIGLGCAGIVGLAEPPRDPPRTDYRAPLLPRVEFLRVIGAGQLSLVTDYFWLQAVQAAGRAGETFARERWLDLYYYADLVTDLDPKFYKVYSFAGNAIPTNLGRETYVNVDEGIAILEKGARAFPDDWRINYHYASQLSFLKQDHPRAAEILTRVARMEGAPVHVAELATRLLALKGNFDVALSLVEAALSSESDPDTRAALERRIEELQLEQVLSRVDTAINAFKDREGRLPASVSELVSTRDLPAAPVDPMKGTIYIGEDGRAYSTVAELRFEAVDYEYRRKRRHEEVE